MLTLYEMQLTLSKAYRCEEVSNRVRGVDQESCGLNRRSGSQNEPLSLQPQLRLNFTSWRCPSVRRSCEEWFAIGAAAHSVCNSWLQLCQNLAAHRIGFICHLWHHAICDTWIWPVVKFLAGWVLEAIPACLCFETLRSHFPETHWHWAAPSSPRDAINVWEVKRSSRVPDEGLSFSEILCTQRHCKRERIHVS